VADNIPAKDGNDADVTLATRELAGAHYDKIMPADPGTGAPFKAADDATLELVRAAVESLDGKMPANPATEGTLAALSDKLPALGQKERDGSVSFTLSSEDEALLGNILQALAPLMSARGVDGSLRIQSQGGTITTITTVGTVTTVTTVTTVGTVNNVANQTAMGGLQAAPQIPSLMNIAAASNIDRMVG
jgi:hypothetical protein